MTLVWYQQSTIAEGSDVLLSITKCNKQGALPHARKFPWAAAGRQTSATATSNCSGRRIGMATLPRRYYWTGPAVNFRGVKAATLRVKLARQHPYPDSKLQRLRAYLFAISARQDRSGKTDLLADVSVVCGKPSRDVPDIILALRLNLIDKHHSVQIAGRKAQELSSFLRADCVGTNKPLR